MGAFEEIWCYVDARAPVLAPLEAAVRIAAASGARLTLVGAVGTSEDPIFETSFGHRVLPLVRRDREDRLRELEHTARTSLPEGRTGTLLLEGALPWQTVVAHAARDRPDLLVVAADGERPGRLGSTSQHLFRHCPVPVWSAHPGRPGVPRRALVAIEPGAASSPERLLACSVLDFALRLSTASGVELHASHAWGRWGEEAAGSRFGADLLDGRHELRRDHARAAIARALDEAGARHRVAGVHLREGEPRVAIPALADELDADLVIVGSAGRRELQGFLVGSTAETIRARVALSVAIVKPPRWTSPVPAAAGARDAIDARGTAAAARGAAGLVCAAP